MQTRWWIWAPVAFALAQLGCICPTSYSCQTDLDCPVGYTCRSTKCWPKTTEDAAHTDAATVDTSATVDTGTGRDGAGSDGSGADRTSADTTWPDGSTADSAGQDADLDFFCGNLSASAIQGSSTTFVLRARITGGGRPQKMQSNHFSLQLGGPLCQ